jgi:hypothetical protein
MPMPRVKFKLRTLMILVAIVAFVIAIGIPVGRRLIWLYLSPPSVPLTFEMETTTVRSTDRGRLPYGPLPVGQAVESCFAYSCELLPSVPTWIPFRVSVVTSLVNPA